MRILGLFLALALVLGGIRVEGSEMTGLPALAVRAVFGNKAEATAAITELRAKGPAGLRALLETHAEILRRGPAPADPGWRSVTAAIDQVSGQRDSYASRLYWYTDLEQAKAAAKASLKPILSLRLLGRLDEELSCANSRLFRITLYSNQQISQLLREKFILHWKSERPVPKVTIDFGDGRKLERTITGNSIHYVLDSDGRPVDALPGLYGRAPFVEWLTATEQLVAQLRQQQGELRSTSLRLYHELRLRKLQDAWRADQLSLKLPSSPMPQPAVRAGDAGPVPATRAALAAYTKRILVERPMLRGVLGDGDRAGQDATEVAFVRMAGLHRADSQLDAASRSLILSKLPEKSDAGLRQAVDNLERAIAIDTLRNEYLFHSAIHRWFEADDVGDVESLNSRVYSELFLTPSSDPWLGLVTTDSYVGIDNEGIRRQ